MFEKNNIIPLKEVFGIGTDLPKYTYVHRENIDGVFRYYLGNQRHIVIYGASKQGKTCLRKKNLTDNHIIVLCNPKMENEEDIWKMALQSLNTQIQTTNTKEKIVSSTAKGELKTGINLPYIAEMGGKSSFDHTDTHHEKVEKTSVVCSSFLPVLIEVLLQTKKRLVLEDFHYLPEKVREEVAYTLKAFHDSGVYVIVIGVWSEQNLFTYYNGDLSGRIDEIELVWSIDELEKVLRSGETALNIQFSENLRNQLLESSFLSVGLLHRLSENVCIEAGILETARENREISEMDFLRRSEQKILNDVQQKYKRNNEIFQREMKDGSGLDLYPRIYNELISATNEELLCGIEITLLLTRIEARANKTICQGDLIQTLEWIETLQHKHGINPILVSYSKNIKKIFLNDREFLFFKKNCGLTLDDLKINLNDETDVKIKKYFDTMYSHGKWKKST